MNHEKLLELLNKFHQARVLVLGDAMLDRFVYGSIERISPEAPIPVISVEKSLDMPGGAANVVRNIAAMGASAAFVGVVGEDVAARDLFTRLKATPTVQVRIIADPSRPTTVKVRYVADRQQVLRADTESCAPISSDIQKQVLFQYESALRDADVVVLSDYAKGLLSDAVASAAISMAKQLGKCVIVDPKSKRLSKYSGATVLTPNCAELQLACGFECNDDEQIARAARQSIDDGTCEAMIVTRGKDGMSVIKKDGAVFHLRTTAREVFDVSGAGDTALAAIALGLACGGDIVDVASVANVAAGIVVAKLGTAVVSAAEIVAAIDSSTDPSVQTKIFSLERVLNQVYSWRARGLKVAFTNGCFDLLHPGHVSLLNQAKRSADKLVVGLNSDLSVRRLKGPGRPVQGEVARATVLSSLKAVDTVIIFGEDTPYELIKAIAPDVLVKGADYTHATIVGADLVAARGGKVVLAELLEGHSTTNTVQKLTGAQS